MGSHFARELCAQRELAVQQIVGAAADGDDMLVLALRERLAQLDDLAERHGLPA